MLGLLASDGRDTANEDVHEACGDEEDPHFVLLEWAAIEPPPRVREKGSSSNVGALLGRGGLDDEAGSVKVA